MFVCEYIEKNKQQRGNLKVIENYNEQQNYNTTFAPALFFGNTDIDVYICLYIEKNK